MLNAHTSSIEKSCGLWTLLEAFNRVSETVKLGRQVERRTLVLVIVMIELCLNVPQNWPEMGLQHAWNRPKFDPSIEWKVKTKLSPKAIWIIVVQWIQF